MRKGKGEWEEGQEDVGRKREIVGKGVNCGGVRGEGEGGRKGGEQERGRTGGGEGEDRKGEDRKGGGKDGGRRKPTRRQADVFSFSCRADKNKNTVTQFLEIPTLAKRWGGGRWGEEPPAEIFLFRGEKIPPL